MMQEIIVYATGAAAALFIGISIYRLLSRKGNPCSGCTGCDAESEFEQRHPPCKSGKSNCSGPLN